MSLTHIEIDDELLERAKRLGRHRTKTATVAAALEEYTTRLNLDAAYDDFFELAKSMDLAGAEADRRTEKAARRGQR
ncbi:type II toxin-antitoxin system VapB family antitoxin [Nocardia sp. NPDC004415]